MAMQDKFDMTVAVMQTLEGVGDEELTEEYGAVYIMNKRKIEKMVNRIRWGEDKKERREDMAKLGIGIHVYQLNEWQTQALERLDRQDDRKILFVVDPRGNTGKTWFATWLMVNKGAAICTDICAVTSDVKKIYNGEDEYVVLDIWRSMKLNYKVIEWIKDGGVRWDPPKVMVMMNVMPDRTKLSRDRYDIFEI